MADLRDVVIGTQRYPFGDKNIRIRYVKTGPTTMFVSASDISYALVGTATSPQMEHIQSACEHSLEALIEQVSLYHFN
jgi:hypothetical protein